MTQLLEEGRQMFAEAERTRKGNRKFEQRQFGSCKELNVEEDGRFWLERSFDVT